MTFSLGGADRSPTTKWLINRWPLIFPMIGSTYLSYEIYRLSSSENLKIFILGMNLIFSWATTMWLGDAASKGWHEEDEE